MKSIILLSSFLICSITLCAQSYLGVTTKQVNFREGPGSSYEIISSLKPNTQVFIISLDAEEDFYNVIDIRTNKTGYIHKSFLKIGKELEKSNGDFIAASGSSISGDTEVEVFNNTSETMTLKLNNSIYSFSPQESKTLTIAPTTYNFIASEPGVTPFYGSKTLESGQKYNWKFFIRTIRR